IDFHHAVTYVTARCAGFSSQEADIIAYAAQYVDDSTSSGPVWFDNKAMYLRCSSAHGTLDLRNLKNEENHLVWLPFHFLPGNGGLPAGQDPTGSFIKKIVCHPNSPVAEDMLEAAISDQGKPFALHRLGITMHVYADTWSHQGFAGVLHEVNEVDKLMETSDSGVFKGGLKKFVSGFLDDAVPPLGHGRALIFPDMPFLSWKYTNGRNELIERNNTELFGSAADRMCRAMQRYRRHRDPAVQETGLSPSDKSVARELFLSFVDKDGYVRHKKWVKAIADGAFSFGSASISYAADGRSSWKAAALGTSQDMPVYSYSPDFLRCDWKFFHDALQQHRLTVSHDILPRYGICAA
ncbi:MAG: hypothetical protein Q8J76_01300, partial [Desulfobulbaceae bacterium]|nr:hypothetical protein [Desulfobulbaceae bacterium]